MVDKYTNWDEINDFDWDEETNDDSWMEGLEEKQQHKQTKEEQLKELKNAFEIIPNDERKLIRYVKMGKFYPAMEISHKNPKIVHDGLASIIAVGMARKYPKQHHEYAMLYRHFRSLDKNIDYYTWSDRTYELLAKAL